MRFVVKENGYAYYPFPWAKGYLIAAEDYKRLEDEHVKRLSFFAIFKITLVYGVLATTIVVIGRATGFLGEGALSKLEIPVAILFFTYVAWIYSAPIRFVRDRRADLPKRSRQAAELDNASMMPWWFFLIQVIILPLFILLGIALLSAGNWWGLLPIILTVWSVYSWGKLAAVKWRMRGE